MNSIKSEEDRTNEEATEEAKAPSNKIVPSKLEGETQQWDRHSNMPPHMMKRWYGGGPVVDKEITELFK